MLSSAISKCLFLDCEDNGEGLKTRKKDIENKKEGEMQGDDVENVSLISIL